MDDEGEQVHEHELIGPSETEHPAPDPRPRYSAPRISQRLPRLMQGSDIPNEGDVLVGRYRVERVLGRTPQEVVLEASHLELAQRVLLRHLTAVASTSPEAVARFQRGARKAREMRSEHAERVLDSGRLEAGEPYRAVELPRGPSLAEILRVRGALPVAEAVDIVLTACEPVAEAHAAGIVHRSLGTSNIFVERRSDGMPLVRVLDFGVSDPLEPDWTAGDGLGVPGAGMSVETLRFASPEQIRNPSAVDGRTDVWALGAILYELIAGAPLFEADSSLTLLSMIVADTPTPLALLREDVPSDLEHLVLSCLEKDPDARPRSVVDVVLALSPYASPEAQGAATRVARIVMRTTRPPAMPSQAPAQSPRPSTSRALMRSAPPPRSFEQPKVERPDTRGFGMLFAGAAIGIAAAILAPRLATPVVVTAPPAVTEARPAATTAAAPQLAPSAGVPLRAAPTALAPTPVVVTAAPAAAPVVVPVLTPVVPAPATPVVSPQPAPRVTADQTIAPRPLKAQGSGPTRTAAAQPGKAQPERSTPKTASADELFGGLD